MNLSAEFQKKLRYEFYKRIIVWVSPIIWLSLLRRISISTETHVDRFLVESRFLTRFHFESIVVNGIYTRRREESNYVEFKMAVDIFVYNTSQNIVAQIS